MTFGDGIVILTLVIVVFFILRGMIRDKKKGKTCGGCSGCSGCAHKGQCGSCGGCPSAEQ